MTDRVDKPTLMLRLLIWMDDDYRLSLLPLKMPSVVKTRVLSIIPVQQYFVN
jgi:hypothetical protein